MVATAEELTAPAQCEETPGPGWERGLSCVQIDDHYRPHDGQSHKGHGAR